MQLDAHGKAPVTHFEALTPVSGLIEDAAHVLKVLHEENKDSSFSL